MVILLLEGCQRFLLRMEEAFECDDPGRKEHFLRKVKAILDELHRRLNHEQGGELVTNLTRLYEWWGRTIDEACHQNDVTRLRAVSAQMGDIRQAWKQVLFKGVGMTGNPDF